MTTFDFLQLQLQLLPIAEVIAQVSPPGPVPGAPVEQPLWTIIVTPVLMVLALYFVLIRPQQTQRAELQKMVEEAKIGDKIETSGGIVGIITNVRDKTFIIKTADQTKLELLKGHINRVAKDAKDASRDAKEVAVTKV